jgi:hypothetical protein
MKSEQITYLPKPFTPPQGPDGAPYSREQSRVTEMNHQLKRMKAEQPEKALSLVMSKLFELVP